jgi:integrase
VDWLEPEQAYKVRETAMQMRPVLGLIVHLELDLLLRRVEVLRLRTRDIHKNYLDVLGKGRNGGKWRTVSLDAVESAEIIDRWLQVRSQMLAQTSGPQTDACMVYLEGKSLVPYKRSAVDDMLKSVMEESGVHFKGNHTLRRTGGRLMWQQGQPIETIASIMGHEDIRTTLKYLGIKLTDQAQAIRAVAEARCQMRKVAQNVPIVTVPGV